MLKEFTLEEVLAPPAKAAPKEFTLEEALATPAKTASTKKGDPTKESMLGVKDLADTLAQLKATTSQLVPGSPMHRDNLVSIAEAERELAKSGVSIPAVSETKPPPAAPVAPAPPAQQAKAKPAFSLLNNDSLGDIEEIKSRTDTRSVLERGKKLPPTAGQNLVNLGGVSPQYVNSLEAQFNAMPEAQRGVVLQQAIAANPENTVKGRAFRAIAERNAAWATALPTAKELDPRLEAVKARIAKKYPGRATMYPELIEQDARTAIFRGQLEDDYAQVSADVIGEKAAAAAEARAKELKGAGFLRRVGAGAASEVEKSSLGILNIYSDALEGAGLLGPDMSKKFTNQRRVVEAEVGAIP